jgi:hypothetical protein
MTCLKNPPENPQAGLSPAYYVSPDSLGNHDPVRPGSFWRNSWSFPSLPVGLTIVLFALFLGRHLCRVPDCSELLLFFTTLSWRR